jgi:hypothetical protein
MKNRLSFGLFTLSTWVLIFCCSYSIFAQSSTNDKEATKSDNLGIALVRFYDFPAPNRRIIVHLSNPQDTNRVNDDLSPSNITVKFLPSGKTIPATLINDINNPNNAAADTLSLTGFDDERIQIGILDQAESSPDPGDNQVEVTFAALNFAIKDSSGATRTVKKEGVEGIGKIYNRANIQERVEETRQALKDAVAHAKTDDEKTAFIGLNVVVPSGGNSEGSGDININRDLYASTLGQAALFDHINFGFHLKKASEDKADPRHFEVGFTFRKTFLRANRATLNRIKQEINNSSQRDVEPLQLIQDVNELQKDFVRAFIFDNALRFEGDVSNSGISNVSNLLWDTQLQVATVSRAFAGQTGFWNFRLVPVGFEVGGNLTNNDDPTQEKNSLARIKAGGELNLIFKAGNPNEPISRIVLSATAVERYLFKRESAIDEMTQKAILTDKGSKYWLEADFKVTTGVRFGAGRVGFKATFNRGSLPPVYNFVKTFKFGVFFETNDDDNSGNIKVQ